LQVSCSKLGIVVFDLDGVLVKHSSSWEYLHEKFGSIEIVRMRNDLELFKKGAITYSEWMRRDLEALINVRNGNIRREDLIKAFNECDIEEGAEEVVKYLKFLGIKVAIVSGGIDLLAVMIAEKLGIDKDLVFANKLLFDEHDFLIPRGIEVVNPLRKDAVLREISVKTAIPLNRFMYVGDSDWDVCAFKVVGYPVFYSRLGKIPNIEVSNIYVVKNMYELKELVSSICRN